MYCSVLFFPPLRFRKIVLHFLFLFSYIEFNKHPLSNLLFFFRKIMGKELERIDKFLSSKSCEETFYKISEHSEGFYTFRADIILFFFLIILLSLTTSLSTFIPFHYAYAPFSGIQCQGIPFHRIRNALM